MQGYESKVNEIVKEGMKLLRFLPLGKQDGHNEFKIQ